MDTGRKLIFMKVGLHAQETIDEIVERKRAELRDEGRIFWGYGGGTCHPISHVQAFAREAREAGESVTLMMEKMNSKHFAEPKRAHEYSEDGVNWKEIPRGINVKGSRYAMILGSLDDANLDLDLSALSVAVGPSRGRRATGYLLGRVDKGCFDRLDSEEMTAPPEPQRKHIDLVGRVVEPYAVLVR